MVSTENKYQPDHYPGSDDHLMMNSPTADSQSIHPKKNIDVQERHEDGQYGPKN